jgi:lipid A 3-O-deacylase
LKTTLGLLLAVLCLAPSIVVAQGTPAEVLTRGTWELGVWTGGGTGLGARSHTQFFNAGFRFGRVLTGYHGNGWYRGNLAFAVDVIPVYYVFQEKAIYGGGANPVLLKWNFASQRRIAAFAEAGGGLLFTTSEVPEGTSKVNFTPQGALGMHMFTGDREAVTITGRWVHVSNAGLTDPNPGINSSLQFTVGYSWFR